jgi:hypothetical protein
LVNLKQRQHVSNSNFDVVINKIEPDSNSLLLKSNLSLTIPSPSSTSKDPAYLKAKLESVEMAISSANELLQDPKVFNNILTARQNFSVDDDSSEDDDNWAPRKSLISQNFFDITKEDDSATIDYKTIGYPDEIIFFFVEKLIAQYKQIQEYIVEMLIKK